MKIAVVAPYRFEQHHGYWYLASVVRFSGYEIRYRPRLIYSAYDVTSVQLMHEVRNKFEPDQVDYQPNMLLPLADEGFETPDVVPHGHTEAEEEVIRYNLTDIGRDILRASEPEEWRDWEGRPFTEF